LNRVQPKGIKFDQTGAPSECADIENVPLDSDTRQEYVLADVVLSLVTKVMSSTTEVLQGESVTNLIASNILHTSTSMLSPATSLDQVGTRLDTVELHVITSGIDTQSDSIEVPNKSITSQTTSEEPRAIENLMTVVIAPDLTSACSLATDEDCTIKT